MIITLSKIRYNEQDQTHRNMLQTVKNHFAIYLPSKTMELIRFNLDQEVQKDGAGSQAVLAIAPLRANDLREAK